MSDNLATEAVCPFCPQNGQVHPIAETSTAYLVEAKDSPVPGCYLIIPKRHVEFVGCLPDSWQLDVNLLLREIPWYSGEEHFNLSYNQGIYAGQRVDHIHGWVIPRARHEAPETFSLELATLLAQAAL